MRLKIVRHAHALKNVHKKASKKAQVASIDLILAAVTLFIFLAFVVFIIMSRGDTKKTFFYGEEVLGNIERLPDTIRFLERYSLNESKITPFQTDLDADYEAMKAKLFNNTIYNSRTTDFCIFYIDLGSTYPISPDTALAMPGHCNPENPCINFANARKKGKSLVKPVIAENPADPSQKKIVNLFVVVCQ